MASYNNNFPYGNLNSGAATYPQYSLPLMKNEPQPTMAQAVQPSQSIFWVNDYSDVEKISTLPNQTIFALHNSKPLLFAKLCNSNGSSVIHAYSLTEVNIEEIKPKTTDDLVDIIKQLSQEVESLKKEVRHNESNNAINKPKQQQQQSNK